MHVFVTGATGFIGLHTVRALLAQGHTVRLGVRNADKMRRLYAAYNLPTADFAVGEITDRTAVEQAIEGCDGVVHTAALVNLDPAHAEVMYRTNVTGTQNVIGCAVEKGLESIVYVSSAAALFNPELSVITDETPLAEARSSYARSKVDAELFVRGLIADGAKVAITYPTGVIGPDDPATSEGNESLLFILRHFHIHTSTGLQVIDVRDLADVHRKLLEAGLGGRYIAAGHYLNWRELGALIEEVTGRRLIKLPIPGPALRLAGAAGDLLSNVITLNSPITREAMNFATRWVPCDDERLRTLLDVRYRTAHDTVRDTIRWLVEAQRIKPRWADKLSDH